MKIEMNFEEFKHWQSVYHRDSVIKQLWHTIGENNALKEELESSHRVISDRNDEIDRLKLKIRNMRKALK